MTLWRLRWATRSTNIICGYATKKPWANHSGLVHCSLLVITWMSTSDSIKTLRRWASTRRSKIYSWEVSNAISIALCFIKEGLLENIISTCFSFHLFQYKVVCRSDLIVLIVLNKDWCLIKEVWICNREKTVVSYLGDSLPHVSHHCNQCLVNDRDWIFSDYNAFIIGRLNLIKPLMRSNFFYCKSSCRIRVQNLFNQILALSSNEAWYQIVTV